MWLNSNNYLDNLKGISIVEISGESCANCLSIMPILHSIVSRRNDTKLFHIEVNEANKEIVERFEIQTVPTILVLYDEVVYARCRGYQPEEILEIWLDAKIEEIKLKISKR